MFGPLFEPSIEYARLDSVNELCLQPLGSFEPRLSPVPGTESKVPAISYHGKTFTLYKVHVKTPVEKQNFIGGMSEVSQR